MATYLIGDIHGCFDTLTRLLREIGYQPGSDRVFLTGDLVNGGPGSAAVVRWAMQHQVSSVLGNHDLHLLAVASGAKSPRRNDTFRDLLESDDREDLLDWLRSQPLLIRERDFLLVHAGLLPDWDVETVLHLAGEAEQRLREKPGAEFFSEMYGDQPDQWRPDLAGMARIRVVINAMTRMRTLTRDHRIDAAFKGPAREAPPRLCPWWAAPGRATAGQTIFFGHWAAQGFYRGETVVGLDSGCAWGGRLTAWRLEDSTVFQVPSELSEEAVALTGGGG